MEYSPKEIESRWQKFWQDNKTFKIDAAGKNKLYVLDMFPYPSGTGLHMGHPLGYTGTDIFCRFRRHQGYSVLHPMGYDAFGLPAEQHAIRTGEHPADVTTLNCDRFTEQLKTLGYSYDWDREIRTYDPKYFKWTQWIFLQIYNSWFDDEQQKARPIAELPIPPGLAEQGAIAVQEYQAEYRLAYYADSMVNWCPELGTVLANEEVIDGKSEVGGFDVIRKPMRQWSLRITKYAERLLNELEGIEWPESIKDQQRNWIGKRLGAEIEFPIDGYDLSLYAFTTRPDTLFGVTFFVVSPEHAIVDEITTDEYRSAVAAYREQAARLSDLDRTMENREKTGQFTGAYVLNPITGENVPLYIGDYVLMGYGTGAVMGVPAHDERDFAFAKKFGIEIKPVIVPVAVDKEIIEQVKTAECCWTEPGVMLACDAPVAIELQLEGLSNELCKQKITDWLAQNDHGGSVVNYRLRDWLFSRQRYWGEPIPIIHWEDGSVSALKEEDLPLTLPEVREYKPSESGESPLARAVEWLTVTCPATGKKGRRETNTMPQWAGSCWYYLRFIDPHNDTVGWDPELEKQWMPVDWYVGGAEHAVLHLLYARFWHKVLFDLGYVSTTEPFQKLFNQGMLVSYAYKDSRGALIPVDEVEDTGERAVHTQTGEVVERITAKMSKSLRNVVNPDDVIEQYGADTLRVYLMFMGPLEAMKTWDDQAITGSNRFIKKVYSIVSGAKDALVPEVEEAQDVVRARHEAIKRVTESMESIRFNTAISALMEFTNTISGKAVSRATVEALTVLVSPLAPHLAEELWNLLGHTNSIAYTSWPTFNETVLKKEVAQIVIQVNGKKRSLFELPIAIDDAALKDAVVAHMADTAYAVSTTDRFITVRDKTGAPKLVNVICK